MVQLFYQVRVAAGAQHLSHRTEDAYHNFIKAFILFHNKRHPKEMAVEEITAFLTYLAVEDKSFRLDAKSGVVRLNQKRKIYSTLRLSYSIILSV